MMTRPNNLLIERRHGAAVAIGVLRIRFAELLPLGGNVSRRLMFNYQTMKTLSTLAMLSVILFTGCATTSHQTAWEYRVIMDRPVDPMTAAMNAAAKDGWEVVTLAFGNSGEPYTVLRRAKR